MTNHLIGPSQTMLRRIFNPLLLCCLFAFASSITFANQGQPSKKANVNLSSDKKYVQFGLDFNEFKDISIAMVKTDSIDTFAGRDSLFTIYRNLPAHTYAANVGFGWYLTESFKTEWRFGKGIRSDNIRETYEVNIAHWFNWYIGYSQLVTETVTGHILLGLSSYEADVKRREIVDFQQPTQTTVQDRVLIQPSPYRNEPGLFKTSFSISWMLGLNFPIHDDWDLVVEYGRLLKDSDTNIEVHQMSTYLKYEF